MTDATHKPRRLLILAGVCLLSVVMAAAARWGQDLRQQRLPGLFAESVAGDQAAETSDGVGQPEIENGGASNSWFSIDGDGLYHTRRVERIFEEGFPIAATDPRLNSPHGATIPWPPYYDATLYALLSPFAPESPEARRTFLEHYCALLPFWFGLLTTALLVCLVAFLVDKPYALTAAIFAGSYFAWNYGAAHYGAPGIGDHHAWVSMLTLMMWALISMGMHGATLDRSRAAAGYGAAAGVIAGLLLGSWVASLISILLIQLAFGVLLMLQRKRPRIGLASMGLAFHIGAFLTVLPAVLSSPWKEDFPWMVVNLSWFHLWELALGGLVFIPMLRKPEGGRIHPLGIPIGILAVIAICMISKLGPGAGILEGVAWVSRANEFMSGIAESEPLWGSGAGFADSFLWLGFGWVLLPIAWLAMLRTIYTQRKFSLLIWAVAIPFLFLQAMTQRRFADALAAPMALCLAWWLCHLLTAWNARRRSDPAGSTEKPIHPKAKVISSAMALVLAIGLNAPSTLSALTGVLANHDPDPIQNAYREAFQWIGEQPIRDLEESVMAPWDQGHAIEWLTNRGSVATNFGTYVGEDSYRDPARFFLATDPHAAEEILKKRNARFVVRPSQLPLSLDSLSKALQDDRVFAESFQNERGQRRDRFTDLWYQTMACVLWVASPAESPEQQLGVGNGDPDGPYHPISPIPFLRLVRLSPVPDMDPRHGGTVMPAAEVWEYVAGAKLRSELNPGESLFIRAGFTLYFEGQPLLSFEYRDSITAAVGNPSVTHSKTTADLRFPYSTSDPSGNGAAQVNSAEYWIESAEGQILKKGPLEVLEGDILRGNTLQLK